jgi:hypothetical protein
MEADHPEDPRSILLGGSQINPTDEAASVQTAFGWEPAGVESAQLPLFWLILAASLLVVFLSVVTLLLLLRRKCTSKTGAVCFNSIQ